MKLHVSACNGHRQVSTTIKKSLQSDQKIVYTLAAFRRLRQCLDADRGQFEKLPWIQNSRTSLI